MMAHLQDQEHNDSHSVPDWIFSVLCKCQLIHLESKNHVGFQIYVTTIEMDTGVTLHEVERLI